MRGEIQVGSCSYNTCSRSCPVPLLKKTVQSCLPSVHCSNNGAGENRQSPPAHSLCGCFTASVANTVQYSGCISAHVFPSNSKVCIYCTVLHFTAQFNQYTAPHRLLALRQRRIYSTLNDDNDASRTSLNPFAALSTKKTCEQARQQSRCWSNEDKCFHSIVHYHQLAAG